MSALIWSPLFVAGLLVFGAWIVICLGAALGIGMSPSRREDVKAAYLRLAAVAVLGLLVQMVVWSMVFE